MHDDETNMELTELEQIEFNRRRDLAYPLIPAAVRVFTDRAELDERIKNESKPIDSYWRGAAFLGGLALHSFMEGNTWSLSLGLLISIWGGVSWFVKQHELDGLRLKRINYTDKLYELQVVWEAATGHSTFWDIQKFAGEYGFNSSDEDFCNWWAEQTRLILERACGWEKGKRISEDWATRLAKFDAGLAELQANK